MFYFRVEGLLHWIGVFFFFFNGPAARTNDSPAPRSLPPLFLKQKQHPAQKPTTVTFTKQNRQHHEPLKSSIFSTLTQVIQDNSPSERCDRENGERDTKTIPTNVIRSPLRGGKNTLTHTHFVVIFKRKKLYRFDQTYRRETHRLNELQCNRKQETMYRPLYTSCFCV